MRFLASSLSLLAFQHPVAAANPRAECAGGDCALASASLLQKDNAARVSAQQALTDNEDKSTKGDADLSELTMLAGAADDDIALNNNAFENLGWTRRAHVVFNPANAQRSSFADDIDHARAYEKNGHCLAVFAATNDMTDQGQGMSHLVHGPVDLCGFQMHPGTAQELGGFMQQAPAQWHAFVSFLASDSCTTRTAVGHSLGGAVASAFAACANVGAPGFGGKKDFRLVTFAPIPIFHQTGPSPSFEGTRYGIVESNDYTSGAPTFAGSPKLFRGMIIDFFMGLASAMPGMGDAVAGLQQAKTMISKCEGDGEKQCVEGTFAHVAPSLTPLVTPAVGIFMDPNAVATQLNVDVQAVMHMQKQMGHLIYASALRGELVAIFDPVQVLTYDWGYGHAQVKFQPLRNPRQPGAALQQIAADDAAKLPKYDIYQSLFATIAQKMNFPNHAICCYSTMENCASQYTQGWKQCVTG